MNSLTVFFAALGFILFGYASFIRILYRNSLAADTAQARPNFVSLTSRLDPSIIFISLQSLGLLLFWGWGPALLWLIVFHLLVETTINICQNRQQSPAISFESHFLNARSDRSNAAKLLWQLFLCLVFALIVSILASLFDKHSGLIFTVIGIYLAWHWLNNNTSTLTKICLALLSVSLGFIFAQNLGWSIYGNWQPINQYLPWLSINNQSIWVVLLLIAATKLANQQHSQQQLGLANGIIVLTLMLALIASLAWQRPELDAPMVVENGNTPNLLIYGLFIAAGMVITIFNLVKNQNLLDDASQQSSFIHFQSVSLVQLLWQIALCLCLAAAIGIGAWQTHYSDWLNDHSLDNQFALAIESLTTVWQFNASLDNSDSFTSTIILSIVVILGLNCLTRCLKLLNHCSESNQKILHPDSQDALSAIQQTSLTSNEINRSSTFSKLALHSQYIHYPFILLLSFYLLTTGIFLPFWLAITALAWFLVCDYLLAVTIDLNSASRLNQILKTLVLIFISLGGLSLLALVIIKAVDGHFLLAVLPVLGLVTSLLLWRERIIVLAQQLRSNDQKALFSEQ